MIEFKAEFEDLTTDFDADFEELEIVKTPGIGQNKTVTPTVSSQDVLPDEGYDYLQKVIVEAIPYSEELNESGGYTAIVG